MNLRQYLNQKDPIKNPSVQLDSNDYRIIHSIIYCNDKMEKVLISNDNFIEEFGELEYFRINGQPNLWTIDSQGNPKSRSVFYANWYVCYNHRDQGVEKYNYSNRSGEFFFEQPLKVVGLIPGKSRYMFNEQPCVFVISEQEDANKWYIESMEIVKETIEWVMTQKNISQY